MREPTEHALCRAAEALDAGQVAARSLDARECFVNRFDGHGHVKSIGVDDGVRIAGQRHVAGPEQQVAATLQDFASGKSTASPKRILLHIAVSAGR